MMVHILAQKMLWFVYTMQRVMVLPIILIAFLNDWAPTVYSSVPLLFKGCAQCFLNHSVVKDDLMLHSKVKDTFSICMHYKLI